MGPNSTRIVVSKRVAGWAVVSIVTLLACFWAYWGGIENFHEGWYGKSLLENLQMMLLQYWLLALVFVAIGLCGVRFPRVTLFICIMLGIFAAFFFFGAHFSVVWFLIVIPIWGIGFLFFFGRPFPLWLARTIVIVPPLFILTVTSIFGIVKAASRVDDGNYGMHVVEGNGVSLAWAPKGPGWPEKAVTYEEAVYICKHLNEEGTVLLDKEVNIWRLPGVEEAVASQMLHGKNAGGKWDAEKKRASYQKTPDKETPLWDLHSPVIYYWTGTMADRGKAYIIVYHGGIFKKDIKNKYTSLSFRAVKDVPQ